jgi:hypothetical protein
MSLQKLISPSTTDTFLSDYFERRPLHVERNDAAYFGDLTNDLALGHQIWRHASRWGDVSLARADTLASENIYARMLPTAETIAAAYADGYTVVVNNYQQKSARIAAFCREVEKFFCFRCNANLYVTGPHCKGLDAHYDDQDVFVMQLAGQKTWRVYSGGPLLPLEDEPYHCPDAAALPFVEVMLRPGDVLYLPRGFIHDARTEGHASQHLTLSVSAVRQVTLLKLLIQRAAAGNDVLRRSIRSSILRDPVPRAEYEREYEHVAAIMGTLARIQVDDIQQVLCDLQDRFLDASARLPEEDLLLQGMQQVPVGIGSQVKIADDQVCLLCEVDAVRILKFIGGQVPLADDLFDAAHYICERKRFRVGDIGAGLSDTEKIAFIQFLMRHGLIVHAMEPAARPGS